MNTLPLPSSLLRLTSPLWMFTISRTMASPAFAGVSDSSSPISRIMNFFLSSKNTVVVKDVDYDIGDREVEFEFKGSVKWKNPTVKITRSGKNYAKKITDKDSDELEVKVKKLSYGKIYSYRITGVKNKKGSRYVTVKGTFCAK